jgi:hypothetical protein
MVFNLPSEIIIDSILFLEFVNDSFTIKLLLTKYTTMKTLLKTLGIFVVCYLMITFNTYGQVYVF